MNLINQVNINYISDYTNPNIESRMIKKDKPGKQHRRERDENGIKPTKRKILKRSISRNNKITIGL